MVYYLRRRGLNRSVLGLKPVKSNSRDSCYVDERRLLFSRMSDPSFSLMFLLRFTFLPPGKCLKAGIALSTYTSQKQVHPGGC